MALTSTLRIGIASIVALLSYAAVSAQAGPNCMTRILADVPAEEAPEQMKSKSNGTFGPVTRIKVIKATGRMFYCAGTSYCYDSNAFEFTSACRLKLDKAASTDEFYAYSAR